MKKEIPQAAIIGAVVLVVLLVVVFAWKALSDGNPARDTSTTNATKPDPLPEGRSPSDKAPPPARGRMSGG